MQKLPDAFDRKKRWRMRKKKGPPEKRRKLILFQAVTDEVTHHLANWWKTPRIRLWTKRWLVLSLVAALSINSMPKYKR